MANRVALLRGINLGPRRRVEMARLRELVTDLGHADVRTYVQSGNVVFTSRASPARLERELEERIAAELGVETPVVVRTRDELAEVVARDPLGHVADDPKRYQVSFLSAEPAPELVDELAALAAGAEQVVAIGRELYVWHPAGVARSKLWARLAGAGLGVTATARNWNTVTKLLELADAG